MKYLLIIFCLVNVSCATLNATSRITEKENGVIFTSNRPAKMKYQKGDTIYEYDSKAESWFSKAIGILTLGMVGAK